MNLPFAELNRCDDRMTHDHENSEPIRNTSLDNAVIPPLRKVMTEMHDDNLMRLRGAETPRSATQLAAISEELENPAADEACFKESKYLCHMRCTDPGFCTICKTKGRLDFAQKHLFKSSLAPAPESDRELSERESDDAQSCHEADLTDPVSNQLASEGQLNDGSAASYMPEDEDDIDFMFMACADWEQAAEDERNAAAEAYEESDKSFEDSSNKQLKRVSKNARKLGEQEAATVLSADAKPMGSCSSFASYLASAENNSGSVDV